MASRKARKLLENMRQSATNWKRNDLDRLYIGFGFVIIHGAKHDTVKHPRYPHLLTRLPRHTIIAKPHIKVAVELIDELEKLMQERGEVEAETEEDDE